MNRYVVRPCDDDAGQRTWDVCKRQGVPSRNSAEVAVSNHDTRSQAIKRARELEAEPAVFPASGPTPEQLAALRQYAAEHGRRWRLDLSLEWSERGEARILGEPSAELQQVRNIFGPSWLATFKLPENT